MEYHVLWENIQEKRQKVKRISKWKLKKKKKKKKEKKINFKLIKF